MSEAYTTIPEEYKKKNNVADDGQPNTCDGVAIRSHPIPIDELASYVASMSRDGGLALKDQFSSISEAETAVCSIARKPENLAKSRYPLYPYDDHRVKLIVEAQDLDENCDDSCKPTDYISASYIEGYENKKRYIGASGPRCNTIVDFWRMAWQTHSKMVVMLCNLEELGKNKCDKYWPDDTEIYGQYKVTMVDKEELEDYVVRRFKIEKGQDTREFTQYHYTSWPDSGVPVQTAPFVSFLNKIRSSDEYTLQDHPIIVHCSAGVGRTGTLILIDTLVNMAAAEGQVDFLKYFCIIRKCRRTTIEKLPQYLFCHQIVSELVGPK